MGVLGSADETYRRHTVTTFIHAVFRRLNEFGVISESEVVVRAEVDHLLSALYGDTR